MGEVVLVIYHWSPFGSNEDLIPWDALDGFPCKSTWPGIQSVAYDWTEASASA